MDSHESLPDPNKRHEAAPQPESSLSPEQRATELLPQILNNPSLKWEEFQRDGDTHERAECGNIAIEKFALTTEVGEDQEESREITTVLTYHPKLAEYDQAATAALDDRANSLAAPLYPRRQSEKSDGLYLGYWFARDQQGNVTAMDGISYSGDSISSKTWEKEDIVESLSDTYIWRQPYQFCHGEDKALELLQSLADQELLNPENQPQFLEQLEQAEPLPIILPEPFKVKDGPLTIRQIEDELHEAPDHPLNLEGDVKESITRKLNVFSIEPYCYGAESFENRTTFLVNDKLHSNEEPVLPFVFHKHIDGHFGVTWTDEGLNNISSPDLAKTLPESTSIFIDHKGVVNAAYIKQQGNYFPMESNVSFPSDPLFYDPPLSDDDFFDVMEAFAIDGSGDPSELFNNENVRAKPGLELVRDLAQARTQADVDLAAYNWKRSMEEIFGKEAKEAPKPSQEEEAPKLSQEEIRDYIENAGEITEDIEDALLDDVFEFKNEMNIYDYVLPPIRGKQLTVRSSNYYIDGIAFSEIESDASLSFVLTDSTRAEISGGEYGFDVIEVRGVGSEDYATSDSPRKLAEILSEALYVIVEQDKQYPMLSKDIKQKIHEVNDQLKYDMSEQNIQAKTIATAMASVRYYLGASDIQPTRVRARNIKGKTTDAAIVSNELMLKDGHGSSLSLGRTTILKAHDSRSTTVLISDPAHRLNKSYVTGASFDDALSIASVKDFRHLNSAEKFLQNLGEDAGVTAEPLTNTAYTLNALEEFIKTAPGHRKGNPVRFINANLPDDEIEES